MPHENLFKIHIPDPCFEDWDKMTPNEQGSFCKVCSKTVVDFSKRSEVEVQQYIAANIDKKICGRFNLSQLEQETEEVPRLKISIEEPKFIFPSYLLPVMTPFRVSALALMLCASAMLSSCGNSEGNSGGDDKPLTGAIALVNDTVKTNKTDSLDQYNDLNRIQGGVTIKNAHKMNYLQDSIRSCDQLETRTVGKLRIIPKTDTLKTDTTETMMKGEIEPRVKMGIMIKLPDENK